MKFFSAGFGNMVCAERIVAIVSPDSSPVKRLVQDAKDSGCAIDVTCGRRTRAVLVLDSGHVILSALQTDTVSARIRDDGTHDDVDSIATDDGGKD